MKKIGIYIMIALLLTSAYSVIGIPINSNFNQVSTTNQTASIGIIIDVSAQEAWDLMVNPDDGRQIPIDMRRLDEYVNERIETPNENDWPRWFPYELTSDGPGPIKNEGFLLQLFIDYYQGKDILIYCRTGRRTNLAAQILIENGFEGTIYNMADGITEWKAIGLPTIQGFS